MHYALSRHYALSIALLMALGVSTSAAQGLSFSGNSLPAIELEAPAASGLSGIYVLHDMMGVTITPPAGSGWERFSSMGTAYAQAVGAPSSSEGNVGYAVTSAEGKTDYYWVVDYSAYPFELRALHYDAEESDCSTTWLSLEGEAERIPYFSITGMPQWLGRELQLSYSTLEFDSDNFSYIQTERTEDIEGVSGGRLHCTPPLCQTDFHLTGDRFARQWGMEQSATTYTVEPTAVEGQTRAIQAQREAENEIKDDSPLGGSGPADITFEAIVTDAAIFHEWELGTDPDFNQVQLRSSDLEFSYTFKDAGTYYVRLTAADESGECEYISDTYEVFIGESQLNCPNAFSPGASPGVNDEWRVSYKSIVEFDCHIFDRSGRELAHLTDPSQGWDGKRGGRVVGPGVYFYVIRAKGADGKQYKLSGDINVVGYKQRTTTNATD